MASQFPGSPKLQKGAFIEFSERLVGSLPHIILFQYNPETMSRSLEAWTPPRAAASGISGDGEAGANQEETAATAQPEDPTETITLALELDAADALEESENHPMAVISGIADRIAALEILLYPQKNSLTEGLTSAIGKSLGGKAGHFLQQWEARRRMVPLLLFAWGANRILPVRLTSFSVEEEAYSPSLFPLRAKVNVSMRVIKPGELPKETTSQFDRAIAEAAYTFYKKQKEFLAQSNVANNVESIIDLLKNLR